MDRGLKEFFGGSTPDNIEMINNDYLHLDLENVWEIINVGTETEPSYRLSIR